MIDNRDLFTALECALATLRGEAGGFSDAEKHKAITVLQTLMDETLEKITA